MKTQNILIQKNDQQNPNHNSIIEFNENNKLDLLKKELLKYEQQLKEAHQLISVKFFF